MNLLKLMMIVAYHLLAMMENFSRFLNIMNMKAK